MFEYPWCHNGNLKVVKEGKMVLSIGDYMDVLIILLAVSIHYSLIIAMKKRSRQKSSPFYK